MSTWSSFFDFFPDHHEENLRETSKLEYFRKLYRDAGAKFELMPYPETVETLTSLPTQGLGVYILWNKGDFLLWTDFNAEYTTFPRTHRSTTCDVDAVKDQRPRLGAEIPDTVRDYQTFARRSDFANKFKFSFDLVFFFEIELNFDHPGVFPFFTYLPACFCSSSTKKSLEFCHLTLSSNECKVALPASTNELPISRSVWPLILPQRSREATQNKS